MKKNIQIIVCGFEESVSEDTSIADLIEFFKEADQDLIVELNGRFIYPEQYASQIVTAGDRIEFINPHFGG